MGLHQYDYIFDVNQAPPAAHLFDTHYLFEQKAPEEYFPVAEKSIQEYKNICTQAGIDPATKMREFLATQLQQKVKIAEQNGNLYTYAIARITQFSFITC